MFYSIFKKKKKEKKKSSRVSKIFNFLSFFCFGIVHICVFLERGDTVLILNLDVKLPDFKWREADYSAQGEFYFCLKSNWWEGKTLNIHYHIKNITSHFLQSYLGKSTWAQLLGSKLLLTMLCRWRGVKIRCLHGLLLIW